MSNTKQQHNSFALLTAYRWGFKYYFPFACYSCCVFKTSFSFLNKNNTKQEDKTFSLKNVKNIK